MFATIVGSCSILISLFTTVYFAVISDYVGRKPVLILNLGCWAVEYACILVVVVLKWPMWLLVPFSMIGGIGGSMPTLLALIFAHTASVNSPCDR